MASLGNSIKNFEGAAKGISPTVDAMAAQKKYGEEMSLAAAQMESLNSLYKVQMESASRQATINEESVENANKLKEQMQSLASNLSSLNMVFYFSIVFNIIYSYRFTINFSVKRSCIILHYCSSILL